MPENAQDTGNISTRLLSTGELAEVVGVTVRTVQYYDQRGLLHPTERSDGGRRLYDEAALERMRTICTLKSLGLPLRAIRGVLESESSDDVLRCLLDEQAKELEAKAAANRATLDAVYATLEGLGGMGGRAHADTQQDRPQEQIAQPSTLPTSGMERAMSGLFAEKGTRLRQTQYRLVTEGLIVDVVEAACIVGGILTGNWWPLMACLPLFVVVIVELVRAYHADARYVCPRCRATFVPAFWEFFFAGHTPKMRKLTCVSCGKKDWCVETSVE